MLGLGRTGLVSLVYPRFDDLPDKNAQGIAVHLENATGDQVAEEHCNIQMRSSRAIGL